MKKSNINDIKKLREKTSASIMECRKALEKASGDKNKAEKLISQWGIKKATKKEGRKTAEGIIEAYIHADKKTGILIQLNCETDFVARTDDFQKLAHEIAMQIAAMKPKKVEDLLKQKYIRDNNITIETLVKQAVGTLGENITIANFLILEI